MAKDNVRGADPDQGFLMPVDMREWLPEDHPVWWFVSLVESLDMSAFEKVNRRGGAGRAAYDPRVLTAVLIYGYDGAGQVGVGDDGQASKFAPVAVADNHTFTTVTAGMNHTCGIDTTGKAWCWGYDSNGQVGDGNDGQADEYAPVAVAGGHTFATRY